MSPLITHLVPEEAFLPLTLKGKEGMLRKIFAVVFVSIMPSIMPSLNVMKYLTTVHFKWLHLI